MDFTKEEFKRLKKQDEAIFNALFHAFADKIYNFLLIKTKGNRDIADDLLNDTFLSAFESAPKLLSTKNIGSWLLKIAHRRFTDYQRKLFRDKKYTEILKNQPEEAVDLDEQLYRKEQALLLNLAMDKINNGYKQVLELKYRDSKTIKEIAGELEKSEQAVVSILFRAKEAVKKEIGKISKGFIKG